MPSLPFIDFQCQALKVILEPSNFLGDDARPLSVACLHVDSCMCVLFYPSRWRTICLRGGSSQNFCYGHVGDTFLPVYVTIHLGIACYSDHP